MRGRWENFDDKILIEEMATIPQPDRGALFYAMDRYAKGDDAGFVVKDYGDGLLMLKKRSLSGRSLFFTIDNEERNRQVLLLAYKKESDEAPARSIATERERMARVLASRREQ